MIKLLFFNPEQYLDFENEPSNYELRLPILNCGIVTSYRDYIYQRVLRAEGRDAMNKRALQEVLEFQPDLVIYSTGWAHESLDSWVLQEIMKSGILVFTHLWDTHIDPHPCEIEWFRNCNHFAVADSLTNYYRYRTLAASYPEVKSVIFTGGNLVFSDVIHKQNLEKIYDVTVVGSNEGQRVYLIHFLKKELEKRGIYIERFGGLVDTTKKGQGQKLTDSWIPFDKYVQIINQSKICLSSQTNKGRSQIKGKIFHYLACETLCLSDYNPDLTEIVPDQCIVYYDSFQQCLDKIIYYINHESERQRIATTGYQWFHSNFDYKKFWSQFLKAAVVGDRAMPSIQLRPNWGKVSLQLTEQSAAVKDNQKLWQEAPVLKIDRSQNSGIAIHKRNGSSTFPKISIVLLDSSNTTKINALDWLSRQTVPKEDYELIWIQLGDCLIPEVMQKSDTVISCGQKEIYHKHIGYNIGCIYAQGQIITVCEPDSVFLPNFVESIIKTFQLNQSKEALPLVLMHHEWLTTQTYPEQLSDIHQLTKVNQLSKYKWFSLWPNNSLCMSIRKIDAMRFGGFDEHPSFRANVCGPYDLGWRLVNTGLPEVWHNQALFRFVNPDPGKSFGLEFAWKLWQKLLDPQIKGQALIAIEALSTGRILPLVENRQVYKLRMMQRQLGMPHEKKYAKLTVQQKTSRTQLLKLRLWFFWQILFKPVKNWLKNNINFQAYEYLQKMWHLFYKIVGWVLKAID